MCYDVDCSLLFIRWYVNIKALPRCKVMMQKNTALRKWLTNKQPFGQQMKIMLINCLADLYKTPGGATWPETVYPH